MQWLLEVLAGIAVIVAVIGIIAFVAYLIWKGLKKQSIGEMLSQHFGRAPVSNIAVNERQFPLHIRADVQGAVEAFLHYVTVTAFRSVRTEHALGGVDFSALLDSSLAAFANPIAIGPPQYEQIDIGEAGELTLEDVQSALDEMLFAGGSLNLKLLGAEQRIGEPR
ncbi:MAG TPA: hypothetical protein VFB96_23780 [Pirellulaceae bacterium]|nr:hypothetical protein [Pirellulaceae bacterium]